MKRAETILRSSAFSTGVLSLLAALGCAYGGSPTLNTPHGSFSNASLNGAYVYELHGAGLSNFGAFSPYREVGVFVADGQGNIGKTSQGSDDVSGSATGVAVTGTYKIAQDGTGSIVMTSQLGTINLAVTLVSNSKVYLMEADPGVNSVGVAELQNSSAITTTPAGPLAFRIHQELSLNGNIPEVQVGAFNASGTGVNGAMDQNAGGTITSPNITWTFNAPGALGRGTGSYVNASTSATNNFVYYIVNSSKVDILDSDASIVGSGEAEAQTGNIGNGLSGTYAFGSSGDDSSYTQGVYGTVATVGEFNASSGKMSGMEDTNMDGSINSSVPTATCETPGANGRVLVTSSSGGSCTTTAVQAFWMVNPSRAFFLDLSSTLFDDGTADLQTVSNFSQSTLNGQFALAMGGVDTTPELLTRIGTLQLNSSGKVSLNELANASSTGAGGQSPGILTGNLTVGSNGRFAGAAGNGNGGVDFVMYAVSGSQAYVLQNDTGAVTSGTVELQP